MNDTWNELEICSFENSFNNNISEQNVKKEFKCLKIITIVIINDEYLNS